MEKVCAGLSKRKWLLPQLSYTGRVLIVNNLVASALWPRPTVLPPPGAPYPRAAEDKCGLLLVGAPLVISFYLPLPEGGQGLVDIASKLAIWKTRKNKVRGQRTWGP